MRRLFFPVLLLVLLAARAASAQALPNDPKVLTGEFENGMRYVIVRHAIPPMRAQVWLHVSAGALDEAETQRGAAHFLSHLAFSGSETTPPDALPGLLDSLGRPGPDVNSHTTFNDSVYKLSLREATPDSVGRAFAFLRDLAGKLTLPAAAIERERAAILAEQKTAANVEQRVQDFIYAQLAPDSLVGRRFRLGTPEATAALTANDLRAFYTRTYVPSNMTLIFVGEMEAADVVKLAQVTIGAGVRAPRPPEPDTGIKVLTAARAAVVSDAELGAARVYILRPAPVKPSLRTVDQLRERVLDSLAVAAFNRRIGSKIATGKFPYESAGAFSSDLAGICQMTGLFVTVDAPAKWRDGLNVLALELQRARLHGLFPSEVNEAKKQFLSAAEQNAKNEGMRQAAAYASALSAAVGNGDVAMSPQQTFDQLKAIFDSVTDKDVSAHFTRLMDPSHALYLLATPATGETPSDADLLAAGAEAVKASPGAETEFVKPEALMKGRPTPGKVVEDRMHEASGVWNAWFDNGVLLHHRRMEVAPGQVTVTVSVAGGLIEENDLNRGLTEAGSVAWSRPATSTLPSYIIQELTRDTIQLRTEQNDPKKLKLGGGPGIDNLLLAVTGPLDKLESGLQLLHLLLTDPVIEAPGLEQWKRTQLQATEARASQPRDVFSDAMLDLLYPKTETRPRPMTREQIERVTLDEAQAWIRRQVATGPVEVSVVGDISREQAAELVGAYIGSLPKRERISETTFDEKRRIAPGGGSREIKREVEGLTETAFVMAGFPGTDAENLPDARLLGLAAQILNERMRKIVQEDAKLVQNVLVQSQPAQEFPGFGLFGIFAPTDNSKTEPAVKKMLEVLDDFRDKGPTVEEVAAAKQQVLLQLEAALAAPDFWSDQLSMLVYRSRSLDDLAGATGPYQNVTPEDIRAAVAKYDTPERRMQLILVQKLSAERMKAGQLEGAGPPAPGAPGTEKK